MYFNSLDFPLHWLLGAVVIPLCTSLTRTEVKMHPIRSTGCYMVATRNHGNRKNSHRICRTCSSPITSINRHELMLKSVFAESQHPTWFLFKTKARSYYFKLKRQTILLASKSTKSFKTVLVKWAGTTVSIVSLLTANSIARRCSLSPSSSFISQNVGFQKSDHSWPTAKTKMFKQPNQERLVSQML